MTISSLANILIAVLLVGWIIYRQFTWQVITPSRLWRMPVIVAAIGVVMLAQTKSLAAITPTAIAILVGELVISVALGAVMGTLARFRSRAQEARDVDARKGETHDPRTTVIESRTGGLGAALWAVLILLRIGIELAVTHYYPSALLASTGTILLVLAANRFARGAVIALRMERHGVLAA